MEIQARCTTEIATGWPSDSPDQDEQKGPEQKEEEEWLIEF